MQQDLFSAPLALAHMLRGHQVETEVVLDALGFLCDVLPFDAALVYDMDVSGTFVLTEQYPAHIEDAPASLDGQFFGDDDGVLVSERTVCVLKQHAQNTAWERKLLTLFGSHFLALAPVSDEQGQLFGMLLLMTKTQGPSVSLPDESALSALLSMLVRYLDMRMYQKKLLRAQTSLERVLDNTGIDIYVNDFYNHDILYVNQSMAAPYGGKAQFFGRKCWEVLYPGQTGPCEFCPQKELIDTNGVPTKVYSWDYQRPFDGSWFRVFSAAFPWVDGRLAHVVSSADITDNKKNEALIENLANYDQLTKLPNRRMLLKECERRIDRAGPNEHGYLLFFDIDGFKVINDTFGHDAGDEFLIQLGEFFSNIPLLKNAIYRNGGDEFVAILGGESVTKEHIFNLSQSIHERFTRPWILKKGNAFCSTSIGVASYPEDGSTAETLLHQADMAMYRVKKTGGAGLCFGYELHDALEKWQADRHD